uniref:UDP-glucuronosyltransferase n=1 Tax=Strigamia maritima TaxID=126957 RepID=T1IY73_STRMM|nr:UDP-glycosyltransferase 211H1 [Strigamia maritima]
MLISKLFIIVFVSLTSLSQASNILVMMPIGGQSHKITFNSIITQLANRGHNITVFSPFIFKQNVKNIILKTATSEDTVKSILQFINTNPIILFSTFKNLITSCCKSSLENSEFKEIIVSNQQFDAVIITSFFNECTLMLSSLLSKVIIQVAGGPMFPWMFLPVTQPPSFVPNPLWPVTDKMTFLERTYNAINSISVKMMSHYHLLGDIESTVWQHYPKAPSIAEAEKRVAFVLQNSDPVLSGPNPSLPHIIDIGGLHCEDAKPIPRDLNDFIETSGDHGFILFSLGSNVKSKFLPDDKKQSFLKALARLNQTVIWKYEDDLKETPKNVLVRKWLPQQDLLGDNRARLFISHGGLLSLQEAVYHRVPIVGIPVFTDQPGNIARVVQLHIGVQLLYNDITEENVFNAITKILNDESYTRNVKKYSSIFRDQPEKPSEKAAFRVEYAIRHSGENLLLKANNSFNLFIFYSVDVILFFITIIVISCVIIKKLY